MMSPTHTATVTERNNDVVIFSLIYLTFLSPYMLSECTREGLPGTCGWRRFLREMSGFFQHNADLRRVIEIFLSKHQSNN